MTQFSPSFFFFRTPDDEERLREELKDLIDDNPIEEDDDSGGEDSDGGHPKRKKSDDEDELDDRLEDEDYDLIEENLGVKVERVSFRRVVNRQKGIIFVLLLFLETVQTSEENYR